MCRRPFTFDRWLPPLCLSKKMKHINKQFLCGKPVSAAQATISIQLYYFLLFYGLLIQERSRRELLRRVTVSLGVGKVNCWRLAINEGKKVWHTPDWKCRARTHLCADPPSLFFQGEKDSLKIHWLNRNSF